MSSNQEFEEKLAVGAAGEDILYSYLTANNSYVEDLRSQMHGNRTGPCLLGTEGRLTLPDFAVYNKAPHKGNFAVDSKVKTSVYTVGGRRCFTVDDKFKQYQLATEIKKLDFLMIVFIFENRMYFYKDSDCCGTTVFGNQFGHGPVYLFEYDKRRIRY
jgi:hypothetical protein